MIIEVLGWGKCETKEGGQINHYSIFTESTCPVRWVYVGKLKPGIKENIKFGPGSFEDYPHICNIEEFNRCYTILK